MRVSLLGRCSTWPGPGRLLCEDADLAPELTEADGRLPARTLTGQLGQPVAGMERWSRLDRYGRALVYAVSRTVGTDGRLPGRITGLYVASEYSCLETNAEFDRGFIEKGPRRASPKLFPFTLPGAAAAEAAAHYQLTGPYLVFPGGPATSLTALLSAVDSLAAGTPRLVVASADVLGPATLRSMRGSDLLRAELPPVAEACAALWLGQLDDPAATARVRIDGALGSPGLDPGGWGALIEAALERDGVSASRIGTAISASERSGRPRPELDALDGICEDGARDLAAECGRAGAPLGLLAIGAALESGGASLVTAEDHGGSAAVVISEEETT